LRFNFKKIPFFNLKIIKNELERPKGGILWFKKTCIALLHQQCENNKKLTKNMNSAEHVGGNLYLNTNEVEVVDFLIDNNLFPKNLGETFIATNFTGMDFNLVFYNNQDEEQRFMHFRFYDFASNVDTFQYLVSMFKFLAEKNYALYTPVQRKLEQMIYMLPTYKALFKYKQNESSDEYQSEDSSLY
jgi:hypothetical protein